VAAFNSETYAHHWFEKEIIPTSPRAAIDRGTDPA
jgi:hypothetical protein